MKYITGLLLLFVMSGYTQDTFLEKPLPIDPNLVKGTLDNGLTYYIYSTDRTKSSASYYLIQNVGSMLENDDQLGLAHFLEHMAFNGTKNFPEKKLITTLQEFGGAFGKEINAYTSNDETVYNISKMPTKDSIVDTCLLILHDWCNYLSLTNKEIDAERGVIEEEWRGMQNGYLRIQDKSASTYFNNTLYAERNPIGIIDIIKNFPYDDLKNFYRDWYRTDLQAIAVIGDIDPVEIEQKIKTLFSTIPPIENPKERFTIKVPDNQTMLYNLSMDDEVSTSKIQFGIRHPKNLQTRTNYDLKQTLITSMVVSMLSRRLNKIGKNPDAAFINASVKYASQTRTTNTFNISIVPKPNQQEKAYESVIKELYRAVKFGFIDSEIKRTSNSYMSLYENMINTESDQSVMSIISKIKMNYLENGSYMNSEQIYNLAKQILETIDQKQINDKLNELFTQKNRYLLVTGVKSEDNLSENNALRIINNLSNDNTLTPYKETIITKPLFDETKVKKGTILSKIKNNKIEATTFNLSNGIKVYYKYNNFLPNKINIKAISHGGLSKIKDSNLPSASIAIPLMKKSGLGSYSAFELNQFLFGKSVNTSPYLSEYEEGISSSSSKSDIESLFQMLNMAFTQPRFDEEAYELELQKLENNILQKQNNSSSKIYDTIKSILYNNHPRERIFDKSYIQDISFEKAKQVYFDRFGNAFDFEFYIVGDIDEQALAPLLEKYIASIPTNQKTKREQVKGIIVNWTNNKIEKEIEILMYEPKSWFTKVFKNDISFNVRNNLLIGIMGDILKLRYFEVLREQEGGTYSVHASSRLDKHPKEEAFLNISFSTNPDEVDKLKTKVNEEIERLCAGGLSETYLDKVIKSKLKSREQQKHTVGHDINLLKNYFRKGKNINDPKNYEDILTSITMEEITSMAKKLLKEGDVSSYEFVFNPLQQAN